MAAVRDTYMSDYGISESEINDLLGFCVDHPGQR